MYKLILFISIFHFVYWSPFPLINSLTPKNKYLSGFSLHPGTFPTNNSPGSLQQHPHEHQ